MIAKGAPRDKREGACRTGPCRMPRRCWRSVNCFVYGASDMLPAGTGVVPFEAVPYVENESGTK